MGPCIPITQMRTIIFGHRGASGYAHGNTMESFEKAVELGADGIEFDCWLTRDKRVVVFHDRFLRKALGKQKLSVPYSTLQQLREIPLPNGEVMPTLEEVLQKFADTPLLQPINGFSNLLFSIDLQDNHVGKYILPILRKYGVTARSFLCSSTLWKFHQINQSYRPNGAHFIASNQEYHMKPPHLGPKGKISKLGIEGFNIQAMKFEEEHQKLLQQFEKKLFLWDLHSKTLLRKYLKYHPYAIYSNFPDKALQIRNSMQ